MYLLETDLCDQKVLIFTYYKDTARYLHRALNSDKLPTWRKSVGDPSIRRIDSTVRLLERSKIVDVFASVASGYPEIKNTPQEINILIATDVMSEGQNLKDCGFLVNYDLHWNPTRMVQRAGRIDRLGSMYDTLTIYNLFPEQELENLLGLIKSLTAKIDTVNQMGFLDASILGEVVTPRDFNMLRRISDEDNQVIEEQEAFLELASSEMLLAQKSGSGLQISRMEFIQDLGIGEREDCSSALQRFIQRFTSVVCLHCKFTKTEFNQLQMSKNSIHCLCGSRLSVLSAI